MIEVPKTEELSSYYQTYFKYVKPGDDLLQLVKKQQGEMAQFFASIPEDKASLAYAPGKWLLKEVVGHLCDTERIMSYRALRIARKDKSPLPGFDENTYTPASNYNSRSLKNIAEELRTVREATITLMENFSPEMINEIGIANNNEISVRANLYMIFVHAQHHMAVIKERYLA